MSDSVRPHRWQPTRLPCPWDSPGKNTGVGCHFLLQCMKEKRESEVAQSCPTLSDPLDCSLPGSSIHGIFQARVLEWSAIAFSTLNPIVIYFILSDGTHLSLHFGKFSVFVSMYYAYQLTPSLKGMTLFRRCPVRLRTVLPGHRARHSTGAPYVGCPLFW